MVDNVIMRLKRSFFSLFAVLLGFIAGRGIPVFSADVRTETMDAYILIDTSVSMGNAVSDAANWICEKLVDGVLIDGDRLSVWTFSTNTARVIDHETINPSEKENIKMRIRRISGDGKAPDIASALREAISEAEKRKGSGSVAYLLVASSLVESGNQDADSLLKRSRVQEFPGWKAVVVGVGIEKKVKEGAKSYFDAVGPQ